MTDLTLRVEGHTLPGLRWCGHEAVHVGVQRGADPVDLVPADAPAAVFTFRVSPRPAADGTWDFRGPYVHGRPGGRFLYLTWGDVDPAGAFTMFRRAKLRLADIPAAVLDTALRDALPLTTRIRLSAADGSPRCAAVRPPDVAWTVAGA
ncbi:DUF5990 family protein [Streptomyces sp. SL13]|uniref:DUF5990 family protein n=1 Tax=Streptantibioticus silvisoli TaxID=2705255 RepID=A0AA90HDD9_9ACTN|nr:DUF5990 family protein [Streptantibioticus silvisoli]MDI5966750.1 DUF5990 family protein [Streptantibioticus silvisoli]MDI5973670.1 DUF5990 family protein [Streptantibioticus silvisoli]